VNTTHGEKIKQILSARLTRELVAALDRNARSADHSARSADKLAQKVFWLDVVVGAATVTGVVVTILQ
jgi:hypothetical protein